MRPIHLLLLWVPLSTAHIPYSRDFFASILSNLTSPITSKCHQQFDEFIANLSNSWTHQMIDAYSSVPKGLVTLKFEDMGDFSKCIRAYGKYCLGYVSVSNDTSLSITETVSFIEPFWAMCLPSGCSTEDSNVVGNAVLTRLVEDKGIKVGFSNLLCQTRNEAEPELTIQAIVTIVVLALLVVVVVMATLYDIYCMTYTSSKYYPFIKAFSGYTNSKHIFRVNKRNVRHLPCLDGIRCLSMMWIVLSHQYRVLMFNVVVTDTRFLVDWPGKLYSTFIISGSLSVDTFLTIGGTLMSYGFMRERKKKIPFNLLQYYLHRYLRLTASLVLVVLVSATLLRYFGSGPRWPLFNLGVQQNCADNWWWPLLYVQNYLDPQKMCLSQCWYTSVDMQLCLISPPLFFALWKYPNLGLAILGLCGLASMGISFYEIWVNALPGLEFGMYGNRSKSLEYVKKYYFLTYTRATPWIVGVVLGYVIFKIRQKQTRVKINKYVVCSIWVMCIGTMAACTLGISTIFPTLVYDDWVNASYAAFARPAWSLAIAWMILACITKNGGEVVSNLICHSIKVIGVLNWFLSLPLLQVCNKFTYSIYLTHLAVLKGIAYSRKWPLDLSEFDMVVEFSAMLILNGVLAILLVLLAECPVFEIEKVLLGKNSSKGEEHEGTGGSLEGTTLDLARTE